MKLDVVMITTDSRPQLLDQSVFSLTNNSATRDLTLTIVVDRAINSRIRDEFEPHYTIFTRKQVGASAARNIGAASIPKYRRGDYVLFLDDDIYCVLGYDKKLIELLEWNPAKIVSGYSHPYNHCEIRTVPTIDRGDYSFSVPLVISTVAMAMRWDIWDDVGYFVEPGGASGSEDFDYCQRASKKGYGFAVTHEQCILHTGLTSSNGNKIVGYQESVELNQKLVREYGLKTVVFQ